VSVTSTNFFRINNGGRYTHNTERSHTDPLVSRLSSAAGTETGIFEFDVPGSAGYSISISGRTYGTLRLSANATGGTKTYAGSGSAPLTVNGDLEINPDAGLSYGPVTNNITVKGNCIIHPGANLNLSNSINNGILNLKQDIIINGMLTETGSSAASKIEFNGTTNQHISVTGMFSESIDLSVNNGSGLTLGSPVVLPGNLHLLNGKIRTSTINLLSMRGNKNYTGGSVASFVDGPMKKIGAEAFSFPVGTGNIYSPIGISAGISATDVFISEYTRSNPQTVFGINYQSPINHISYVEYWKLVQEQGNSVRMVTLSITATSFCKNLSSMLVALFDQTASQWKNGGQSAITTGPPVPPLVTGSITSNASNNYGIFTLATTESYEANPLPIHLQNLQLPNERSKELEVTIKSIMPGLINSYAVICIRSGVNNQIELIVAGINGQIVRRRNVRLIRGENRVQFNWIDLPNGVYIMYGINVAGRTNIISFVKQ
jgi:hypothetical protein